MTTDTPETEQENTTQNLVAYTDQVIMLGADWSDTRGHTAKFQFTEAEDGGHPLRPFKKGTRFHIVLVELADDDEPIDQAMKKRLEAELQAANKGGRWSNDCAMLCKTRDFQRYLLNMGKMKSNWDKQTRETMAREYVLDMLKIKSRREIDHSEHTIATYNNLILKPYHDWMRTNGENQ